jgi:ribosome-associated heat shock protein Hsp15
MSERHRIDYWLKLVCLFKHRGDATDACRGGHIKLNGFRAKPSSPVKEGDIVELVMGERYRKLVVSGLPETSISKEVARTMYIDETPVVTLPPALSRPRDRGTGRPTKRERREIEKFKR